MITIYYLINQHPLFQEVLITANMFNLKHLKQVNHALIEKIFGHMFLLLVMEFMIQMETDFQVQK